jgi:hypothetical protein
MNFGDQGQVQFDNMMETAVFSAANSEDGAMMLAKVMTNSDSDTMGTMMNYISDVAENDPYSTLAAEVLSEVASTTANTENYFDAEQMNQFSDLVNTIAYTDTAADDAAATALAVTTAATTAADDAAATGTTGTTTTTDDTLYDAAGFAFAPPYYHKETGTMYNNSGFDKDGNSSAAGSGSLSETYDSAGFNIDPPYYHKETGTMYNNAGLDKYGNTQSGAYDAGGFSTTPPYYHKETGTMYNNAGLDKYGNSSAAGGGSVAWTTTSAMFPSTLTKDTGISSITLSATGVGTISYTSSGTFPSGINLAGGIVSGTPNTEQAATSVTITATDDDNNTSDLTVSFPAVTAAGGGSFDENGFSTVTPFLHQNGTDYDNAGYNRFGYNSTGFNAASNYNAAYDTTASPS